MTLLLLLPFLPSFASSFLASCQDCLTSDNNYLLRRQTGRPEDSYQEGGLERENENNMHKRAPVPKIVLDIFKYISSFNYQ